MRRCGDVRPIFKAGHNMATVTTARKRVIPNRISAQGMIRAGESPPKKLMYFASHPNFHTVVVLLLLVLVVFVVLTQIIL